MFLVSMAKPHVLQHLILDLTSCYDGSSAVEGQYAYKADQYKLISRLTDLRTSLFQLKNLYSFSIFHDKPSTSAHAYQTSLAQICDLVSLVTSPKLEDLDIAINFWEKYCMDEIVASPVATGAAPASKSQLRRKYNNVEYTSLAMEYAKLEDVLLGHELPDLRHVTFMVPGSRKRSKFWSTMLSRSFPTLCNRGFLRVKYLESK